MSQKIDARFLSTSPSVWTFDQFLNKKRDSKSSIMTWAWANFGDLRKCTDNIRQMTGRFVLSSSPNNPELFLSFGHLMAEKISQDGIILYTFLEQDGGRCHLDVEYCHHNVDELFVPMGWAKIVLDFVSRGINIVRHQGGYGEEPHLYAQFEGARMKQEVINVRRSRMGWKLAGPIVKL